MTDDGRLYALFVTLGVAGLAAARAAARTKGSPIVRLTDPRFSKTPPESRYAFEIGDVVELKGKSRDSYPEFVVIEREEFATFKDREKKVLDRYVRWYLVDYEGSRRRQYEDELVLVRRGSAAVRLTSPVLSRAPVPQSDIRRGEQVRWVYHKDDEYKLSLAPVYTVHDMEIRDGQWVYCIRRPSWSTWETLWADRSRIEKIYAFEIGDVVEIKVKSLDSYESEFIVKGREEYAIFNDKEQRVLNRHVRWYKIDHEGSLRNKFEEELALVRRGSAAVRLTNPTLSSAPASAPQSDFQIGDKVRYFKKSGRPDAGIYTVADIAIRSGEWLYYIERPYESRWVERSKLEKVSGSTAIRLTNPTLSKAPLSVDKVQVVLDIRRWLETEIPFWFPYPIVLRDKVAVTGPVVPPHGVGPFLSRHQINKTKDHTGVSLTLVGDRSPQVFHRGKIDPDRGKNLLHYVFDELAARAAASIGQSPFAFELGDVVSYPSMSTGLTWVVTRRAADPDDRVVFYELRDLFDASGEPVKLKESQIVLAARPGSPAIRLADPRLSKPRSPSHLPSDLAEPYFHVYVHVFKSGYEGFVGFIEGYRLAEQRRIDRPAEYEYRVSIKTFVNEADIWLKRSDFSIASPLGSSSRRTRGVRAATLAAVPAAGSAARRHGSFEILRKVPIGFTLSPLSFIKGTVLEQQVDPDNRGRAHTRAGLFHVTTNGPAVLADALRSRRQLAARNTPYAGLGGGVLNEAPDKVSVGLDLDAAIRVADGLKLMAEAVHGQIAPADALARFEELSAGPLDAIEATLDYLAEGEDIEVDVFERKQAIARKEVLSSKSGPALYEALRAYEQLLADTIGEWLATDLLSDDALTCGMTIGFTEPAHRFARVRVQDIVILKVAARKGARAELVPGECELRFASDDLVVIGRSR